jgi:retron-type reverse transcriptase
MRHFKFFHSYLSNRLQRVKIDNCRSQWKCITKGVPQGSVLGPALFNVFVNDIFNTVQDCQIYNYADDNVLSFSADTPYILKDTLESDVSRVLNWFIANGLKANPDKFNLLFLVIN